MIFNDKKKKNAISIYQRHSDEYLALSQNVAKSAKELLEIRIKDSNNAFLKVKKLFNNINLLPDEYTTSILNYEKSNNEFSDLLISIEKDGIGSAEVTADLGVATEVDVSIFGPTAVMAIATTFGTASTWTALARLDGRTIAARGNKLLTLLAKPPVTGAITRTVLSGGGVLLRNKIIDEAHKKTKEIYAINQKLKFSLDQIQNLIKQTLDHITSIDSLLNSLTDAPALNNYSELEKSQLSVLLSVKNNLNRLTGLLTSTVDEK